MDKEGYTPYLTRWHDDDDDGGGHALSEVSERVDNLSIVSEDRLFDEHCAPSMDSGDSKMDDRVDVDIVSCFNMSDDNGASEDSMDELLKQSLSELSEEDVVQQEVVIPSISKMDSHKSEQTSSQLTTSTVPQDKMHPVLSSSNMDHVDSKESVALQDQQGMVSLTEYQLLQEQLAKWQSTAYRWQNMVNVQEAQTATMLRRETKYKEKVRDQQLEILALTKRLRQKEYDLGQSIKALKQRESELEHTMSAYEQFQDDSAQTINELIGYKERNEYRRKNSYCEGTLWKFKGDGMNKLKAKAPKLKCMCTAIMCLCAHNVYIAIVCLWLKMYSMPRQSGGCITRTLFAMMRTPNW